MPCILNPSPDCLSLKPSSLTCNNCTVAHETVHVVGQEVADRFHIPSDPQKRRQHKRFAGGDQQLVGLHFTWRFMGSYKWGYK